MGGGGAAARAGLEELVGEKGVEPGGGGGLRAGRGQDPEALRTMRRYSPTHLGFSPRRPFADVVLCEARLQALCGLWLQQP